MKRAVDQFLVLRELLDTLDSWPSSGVLYTLLFKPSGEQSVRRTLSLYIHTSLLTIVYSVLFCTLHSAVRVQTIMRFNVLQILFKFYYFIVSSSIIDRLRNNNNKKMYLSVIYLCYMIWVICIYLCNIGYVV